jgi:hypothetical protein
MKVLFCAQTKEQLAQKGRGSSEFSAEDCFFYHFLFPHLYLLWTCVMFISMGNKKIQLGSFPHSIFILFISSKYCVDRVSCVCATLHSLSSRFAKIQNVRRRRKSSPSPAKSMYKMFIIIYWRTAFFLSLLCIIAQIQNLNPLFLCCVCVLRQIC